MSSTMNRVSSYPSEFLPAVSLVSEAAWILRHAADCLCTDTFSRAAKVTQFSPAVFLNQSVCFTTALPSILSHHSVPQGKLYLEPTESGMSTPWTLISSSELNVPFSGLMCKKTLQQQ